MELVNTLIAVGVGASLGAFLSYVVGVRQALVLDGVRRKQDEKTATVVIANELSRIIHWHDKLLALKKEIDVFEVWGMFLPINSLGQYREIMKKVLSEEEFKDLEKAYIGFSTFDREMQGVVQAWISSGHDTPKGPAKRWSGVFWDSVRNEETTELVKRLKSLLKKLEDLYSKA